MFSPKILFEPCLDLRMTMRIKLYFKFFCKYFFLKRHPGKLHFTFPHQANMVVFIKVGYGIFPPKLFLFMCAHYLILLNFLNSFFLVFVLYFLVVFWPLLILSLSLSPPLPFLVVWLSTHWTVSGFTHFPTTALFIWFHLICPIVNNYWQLVNVCRFTSAL